MFKCIENFKKYGASPTTHDILKYIALATMFVDHIGLFIFDDKVMLLRAIGRWSFPLWGFLAGYAAPKKFEKDIFVLAILLVIVDYLLGENILAVNILFSLLAARLYIKYLHYKKYDGNQIFLVFLILSVWLPLSFITFEYGTLAFMLALCGYLQRNYPDSKNTSAAFMLTTVIYIVTQYFALLQGQALNMFVAASGVILIMHYLQSFRLEVIEKYRYKGAHRVGMFLARNSLYVYFLHFAALLMISEWFIK